MILFVVPYIIYVYCIAKESLLYLDAQSAPARRACITVYPVGMNYISVKATSEECGISERKIQRLCEENRIEAIERFGRT